MERHIILAILISALMTALMRTLPIMMLSRFRLPVTVQQWLSFIPSAIMASIIATELIGKPTLTASGISLSLLAALASLLSGVLTRSLFVTVIVGVLAYAGLRYLYGIG